MPVEIGPITVVDDTASAVPQTSASGWGFLGDITKQTLSTFADRAAQNFANKLAGINQTPAAVDPASPAAAATAPKSGGLSLSPWLIGGAAAVAVLSLVLVLRNR